MNDDVAITAFLNFRSEAISAVTKKMIIGRGLTIEEEKPYTELLVSADETESKVGLNFKNILFEIATVDRDDVPLRFDHKLFDLDYYIYKSIRVLHSRLDVMELLVKEFDEDFLESIDEFDKEIE